MPISKTERGEAVMRVLVLVVLMLTMHSSMALAKQTGPAFEAVCEDDSVVAFRYETDFSGKPSTHCWSEGDKFGGPWTFVYDGGDVMLIDGKEAIVVGSNGPSVVAIQPAIAAAGAGVWSYVIHTELQMVVAAQVNGFSLGISHGVKTRSVSFQCTFMP